MRRLMVLCAGTLLAGCGGKSTGEWIGELGAADSARRLRAIKALEGRRSESAAVVPALAKTLGDPDAFVRRDAALALGRFGPEARPALPSLLPLLRDRQAGVRKAAARAVGQIDPEAAAKARVR
jgi:HEAT repeat protein